MEIIDALIISYRQAQKNISGLTVSNETNQTNATSISDQCLKSIDVKKNLLFYYMLIPAGAIIIVLSFLRKRRVFHPQFLQGRPGIPYPVNCLEEQENRISYVAAFGLITWMLYDSLFGNDAFGWSHDVYFENFLLLGSAFLIGLLCYPIFGALSSRHCLGYALGSVYTWAIAFIYVLANYPCENFDRIHMTLELLWALPPAICLLYLSISLPCRVLVCLIGSSGPDESNEYLACNSHLYEVQHVKRLLKASFMLGREQEDAHTIKKKIYRSVKSFRYSISILAAVLVSIQFICMLNLKLIESYVDATGALDIWINHAYAIANTVIKYENNQTITDQIPAIDPAHVALLLLELACRVMRTMGPGLITCWCLALVVTSVSLLISLKRYRAHLLSIYKGDWSGIPKFDDVHPRTLLVSSAKFAGYQLGYAAWGFLVQSTVFIAIAVFGMAFILLVSECKMLYLLTDAAKWAGPLLLYLAFLYVTQILLTHFCFLQKDEQGERVLALNNRNLFFNFHYFMIFGNAGLGVMSSILRVLKAAIYGLWILPRLDMSTLGREFEQFDSGFAAYVAMLKVENAQTNPVLVVFTNLLLDAPPRRKVNCIRKRTDGGHLIDDKIKISCEHCRRVKRSIFRNRWCVLITLHNNPSLRKKRKEKMLEDGTASNSKRGSTIFLDMVTDALDLFIQNV